MARRPWLKVSIPPEDYVRGVPDSIAVTSIGKVVSLAGLAGVAPGTWVSYAQFETDPSNSATLYVGGAAPAYPMAKGTVLPMPLPPHVAVDLGEVSIDDRGNSGQLLYIYFIKLSNLK